MHALHLLALTALTSALPGDHGGDDPSCPYPPAPQTPFTLEPAFVFTLNLTGDNPKYPEIQTPLSTGTQTVRPVLSGTVTGPLLNGVIYGGVGWVYHFDDPVSYLEDSMNWGLTDDGESFAFKHHGVGNPQGMVDRVEVTIGGKYAYLNTAYLLQATERHVTAEGAFLRAEVFLVGSTLQTT